MKRLIALAVLVLLMFYVAWPSWTGYQIANAIKAKDEATLERKVAFADVRETLKPAAVQKIGELYDQFKQQVPLGAAIAGSIKSDVAPAIAEQALRQIVTPGNLIRVVNDGGTLKQNAERILQEQIAKIGGLPGLGGLAGRPAGGSAAGGGIQLPGGLGNIQIPGLGGAPKATPAPTPAASATPAPPAPGFGISNIKRFGFLGPLAFEVGVAKDQAAAVSDVLVEMRFVGGDWRIVGVRPRI